MICPFCKEEMEIGRVGTQESHGLFFVKQNDPSPSIWDTRNQMETQGVIVLGGPHFFRIFNTFVPAFACRKCKKILVDYSAD